MAKNTNDAASRMAGRSNGRSDAALHDVETDSVTDRDHENDDELGREAEAAGGEASEERAARPVAYARADKPTAGFFDTYRPGQGGRVRWGTAAAAALLIIWASGFVFEKLGIIETQQTRIGLQIGFTVAILLGGGIWAYHMLSKSRRTVDFLIATEGEMKKVNWSTRKEVIGSTKVVIFVMVAMALILFIVDFGLLEFFSAINVLRLFKDDPILTLFGGS